MTQPCPQTAWRLAPADAGAVSALARESGLSDIVTRILVSRGVTDADAADRFLEPSLSRDWLDPHAIPGMAEACERVAAAIRSHERIVVFGDFDLDGISAAAVATRGLAAMGADVRAIVPHRFREGYGLSEAAIDRVVALEPALMVTVDCGISSAAEVEVLLARGVDVVITDHHEPSDRRAFGRSGRGPEAVGGLPVGRPRGGRRRPQARPWRRQASRPPGDVALARRLGDARYHRRHRLAHRREPRARGRGCRLDAPCTAGLPLGTGGGRGCLAGRPFERHDRILAGAASERRGPDGGPCRLARTAAERRPGRDRDAGPHAR